MIYISSDHAGFSAKQSLVSFLESKEYEYIDLGPDKYIEGDDYPAYAFKLGAKVVEDKGTIGILVCGSGVGMTVAANKVKGVRAAFVESADIARRARTEDLANVIVFDALTFNSDKDFYILDMFLNTNFGDTERYIRRRDQIINYENQL